MKLAEYVAKFLEAQGIKHVFGVSGGASLHLIHGITDATGIKFIPTTHESNAGFAADAYARITGLGAAIATSGPGATNLITAISAAYYDSVPVLFLTGNVATFRFGAPLGVRQYGFQETPIVEMVKPITKYAVCVAEPKNIAAQLVAAVAYAYEHRQGPVLVDIPDDIQRANVNLPAPVKVDFLKSQSPRIGYPDVSKVIEALRESRRPIFIWGAGIRPYAVKARALARSLGIPVACTWGAIDLMHADDPLMAGGFGTHGNRGANFAVQNSDLIISVGCRLDTKATGTPKHFARGARIVMVDIDGSEIGKFGRLGRQIDIGIEADAGDFIDAMSTSGIRSWLMPPNDKWKSTISGWKHRYQSQDDPAWKGTKPYALVRELAKHTTPDDIIVSDTGTALGYLMQAFPFKGERFIHAFNATPMGYGLPAALGCAMATGRKVVLLTGDGSILMSLAELATISRHNLPIKIILLDNKGHAMCRQTQRQWLGGKYPATSIEGGLGMPDNWTQLAHSMGFYTAYDLWSLMNIPSPTFLNVNIDPDAQLMPQAKYGQPLEDADPQLPRDEFRAQMIVHPIT